MSVREEGGGPQRTDIWCTPPHTAFYDGGMLSNPACGGHTPSASDLVVALPTSLMHHCGDSVKLQYQGKTVYATAVDECPTCQQNQLDVSPGVFKQFATLDVGELHGMTFDFDKNGPKANHNEYHGWGDQTK